MESQLSGSPFTVCSFNMGSSVNDYLELCRYTKQNLQFKTKVEEDAFFAKYATVQKITAEKLLARNCDLYCLQEVGDETRPLVEMLKKKNYRILHIEQMMFDTAIAINQDRFSGIVNLSHEVTLSKIFKKDVAMGSAIDTKTGGSVIIVSGHVPGFTFADPQADVVAEGDNFCKAISERLSQISGPVLKVIGADMNGSPEIAEERFQAFSEAGFQICRTQSPTNLNLKDAVQPERELDFIFVKNEEKSSSLLSKLVAHFQKKKDFLNIDIDPKNLLTWDPEQNSSDHLPICVTVTQLPE